MSYESANLNKYTTRNFLYRWHIRSFHTHLVERALTGNPTTLLDAGCGEGHLSVSIKTTAPDIGITAVDFSQDAILYARQHFPEVAEFEVGDLLALDFDDGSFDTVVCSQVLEHLNDPDSAVAELKRVARHHILISVPLEPYFRFFNDIARAMGISPDPGHVQFWTGSSFRSFIRRHFTEASFGQLHYYQSALCRLER